MNLHQMLRPAVDRAAMGIVCGRVTVCFSTGYSYDDGDAVFAVYTYE
jgi:hypothetical protein